MNGINFLYAATARFDPDNVNGAKSWQQFIEWSELAHLTEIISLDGNLNEPLVAPDYNDPDDWSNFYLDENRLTGLFLNTGYVLKRLKQRDKFNLLMVVIAPGQECKHIQSGDYEFKGYDLLDQYYSISVLTNCGGLKEPVQPAELNASGLVDNLENALELRKRLFENNSDVDHADSKVIAIWRHKTVGR